MLVFTFTITGAFAADTYYVNNATEIDSSLAQTYAVGKSGTQKIGSGEVYALTGQGLQSISGDQSSSNGGGGLISENGSVEIKTDIIKVGLNYYYSSVRDSGLIEARLENKVGSGYQFGYYDNNRQFVAISSTSVTRLTMRIISGTGIGVYATDTGEMLYSVQSTSASNKLAINPICTNDDSITWFAGYQYYGGFEYAMLGAGKISVINVVDIEKYVMGVCANEMDESWPIEALKAQAICARSYVAKYTQNSTYYYNCGFDVTNNTYCQAYSGCGTVGPKIEEAVNSTVNRFLSYNGEVCEALYFSSDGGATEDNYNVNGNNEHPYLIGVADPYEKSVDDLNSYSTWRYELTPSELGAKVGLGAVSSAVASYSDMGNVIAINFTSTSGSTVQVLRSYCRTTMEMPSIRYTITKNASGNFVFEGSGWGHNLGMSQFGAYAMARDYGMTYKDILGYYYTGVSLSYGVL